MWGVAGSDGKKLGKLLDMKQALGYNKVVE
jgi:hypothetical protein